MHRSRQRRFLLPSMEATSEGLLQSPHCPLPPCGDLLHPSKKRLLPNRPNSKRLLRLKKKKKKKCQLKSSGYQVRLFLLRDYQTPAIFQQRLLRVLKKRNRGDYFPTPEIHCQSKKDQKNWHHSQLPPKKCRLWQNAAPHAEEGVFLFLDETQKLLLETMKRRQSVASNNCFPPTELRQLHWRLNRDCQSLSCSEKETPIPPKRKPLKPEQQRLRQRRKKDKMKRMKQKKKKRDRENEEAEEAVLKEMERKMLSDSKTHLPRNSSQEKQKQQKLLEEEEEVKDQREEQKQPLLELQEVLVEKEEFASPRQ